MRNYLVFDGLDSRDFGVYISGSGVYNSPARVVNALSVPGRNGDLLIPGGKFENIEVTYPAFIYTNFKQNLADFRSALSAVSGYGRLTDTYHTDEYRLAYFAEGIEVDARSQNDAGEFEIVFNCKPQRFLTSGETPITIGEWGETTEHSGSIATFEAVDSDAVKSLKVALEPVQSGSGDPSPSNVRPISGHDSVEVVRTGKNLFDPTNVVQGSINGNDGVPFGSTTRIRSDNFISLKQGTYTISANNGLNVTCYVYGTDGSYIKSESYVDWSASNQRTITLVGDRKVLLIFRKADNSAIVPSDLTTPMLELGSTATAYEPYQGETYTTDLGGTYYGGTLDVVSGVLTVDKVKWIPTAVSVSSVTMTNGNAGYKFNNYSAFSGETLVDTSRLLDVTATFLKSSVSNWLTPNSITLGHDGKSFFACLPTDIGISTVSAFNSWITTNGYYIVYPLATPQTIQLTPQQVALLVGTNNVWSDSGDVTVEVGTNPNMLVNPTLFASKPLIRVTGYGTLTVGSDVVTIAQNFAYVDIDSEVGDCYHGTDNANASVSFQQNDFPELAPGATGIAYSGHITKVEITPRWWRL